MNIALLRRKRVIVPAVVAVAVLSVGGTVWTATASDDVRGTERDRVAEAATAAVGGTVTDVEAADGAGEAYEVDVRLEDGTEVEVVLDRDLTVLSQDAEDSDEDVSDDREDESAPDADDRALSASERSSAEEAAASAVTGGTVLEVEAGDDRGVAYEVEVRSDDNREWDVELDADFRVVHKSVDD